MRKDINVKSEARKESLLKQSKTIKWMSVVSFLAIIIVAIVAVVITAIKGKDVDFKGMTDAEWEQWAKDNLRGVLIAAAVIDAVVLVFYLVMFILSMFLFGGLGRSGKRTSGASAMLILTWIFTGFYLAMFIVNVLVAANKITGNDAIYGCNIAIIFIPLLSMVWGCILHSIVKRNYK